MHTFVCVSPHPVSVISCRVDDGVYADILHSSHYTCIYLLRIHCVMYILRARIVTHPHSHYSSLFQFNELTPSMTNVNENPPPAEKEQEKAPPATTPAQVALIISENDSCCWLID